MRREAEGCAFIIISCSPRTVNLRRRWVPDAPIRHWSSHTVYVLFTASLCFSSQPFRYNYPKVELLLNCLWLALSLSLVTAWTISACRQHAATGPALLPSRRRQFTAVLLLVVLLFPVISLTDDLAMCAATRDTEQALRLNDLCTGTQPATLPSNVPWMEMLAALLHAGSHRALLPETQLPALAQGMHQPLDSRPPPALA